MTSNHQRRYRRFRMPRAVLSLLALVLVFFTSLTHQQATAGRTDLGFVGNLNPQVVAIHHATIGPVTPVRGTTKGDAGGVGDSETADWCPARPGFPGAGFCRVSGNLTAVVNHSPASPRFLIPFLRAPPLA